MWCCDHFSRGLFQCPLSHWRTFCLMFNWNTPWCIFIPFLYPFPLLVTRERVQHIPFCWPPLLSFISLGLACPNVASALPIVSSCLTVLGFLKKLLYYKLCLPTTISLPPLCVKAHLRARGILKLLWFEFGESRQLRRARIQPLYLSDPRKSTAQVIDVLPKLYEVWNTVESIAQSVLSVSCMQTAMKNFYCLACD